jgi:hypothetical protein
MRTKTLLLTAALSAAGVAASMAQVYSINIVGYVNVPLVANQNALLSNPLDNTSSSASNTLQDLLSALPAKSAVQLWSGTAYLPSNKGATWSPNLHVPVGTGFFLKSPNAFTNTFVGQVAGFQSAALAPGGSTSTNMPALNELVGSAIPFTGTLNDTNTINLLNMPAKSAIQIWTGTAFSPANKGATWSPNLTINPAQGFFLKANAATTWTQTLP